MLKHFVIATVVSATGMFASVAMASEMTMPGGTFASASSATGEVETAAATVRDSAVSEGAAMHETTSHGVDQTAHTRIQPDSVAATRTDSTHAAVGTDAAATTDSGSAPAHRTRQRTHWQSLLPGVMK